MKGEKKKPKSLLNPSQNALKRDAGGKKGKLPCYKCLFECIEANLANIPGGGGAYLTKFNTGRLRPEVQPLTLSYTILAEKVPLLYTFY